MQRIRDLFSDVQWLLEYKIYDTDHTHVTVGTFLMIIISLLVVTFVLKLLRRLITAKLPDDDKNKFVSIFGFFKYVLYILVVITVLHSSGVNLTVLLTASAALFVGLGFALQY